ncbi:flavodoxin family protein [[Clostridium] polysaccharolyticum]|uniref:Flavodoxin domain-containing protein n=1 Tax=[Clostridium] polysaccharolyticum TaxID=29364 RepID=A0A1I0EE37_9FIRM|nr:flavodoxin domain-containing protein [[Clostridium] polysaccharolyticum]SET43539.1 Flavodoxin domain-containing protein [[Clostridium] polysaccharolyticum]
MKTLVVFYSKTGITAETAKLMKKQAGDHSLDVVNIKENKKVSPSGYDRVYIGSGVYGGSMPMELAQFVQKNASELKEKKLIVFIHALGSEEKYQKIAAKIMSPLGRKNYEVFYLGGKAELSKQNFFIRALMKKLAKAKNLDMEYPNTISQSEIQALLKTI